MSMSLINSHTHIVNSTRSFDACFAGHSELLFNKFYNYIFWQLVFILMSELSFVCHSNVRMLCVWFTKPCMVNFWWFENWILSPFTRRVRVVKGRAIKIVLHVTHMSRSIAVNARKKIDWQNPPTKYTWKCPPLPHHQTVPCHFTFNATEWLTDFVRLSTCQTKTRQLCVDLL